MTRVFAIIELGRGVRGPGRVKTSGKLDSIVYYLYSTRNHITVFVLFGFIISLGNFLDWDEEG